jgi:hypothetical protein
VTPRLRDGIIGLSVLSVAFSIIWVIGTANRALQALPPLAQSLGKGVSDASGAIQQAALGIKTQTDNLGGVISAERDASKQQLQESKKIMAATKEVLVRTDCQLNGGPGCAGVLPSATQLLYQSQEQLQATSLQANAMFQAASQSLDSLNRRISDPRIDSILGHIDMLSLHLDDAAGNFASTTAHIDHTVAYYDRQLTKPVGFFKTVAKIGLHMVTVPLR